jgi:hypothetical protein
MRHKLPPLWIVAAVQFAVTVTLARRSDARACSTDSNCPMGFQCMAGDAGPGSSCAASACQSNSDCATGFSCYENIDCVPGPDASSVPGNLCVPQWQGQCTTDSDCGQGYQCDISSQACDCSGTGKSVPPDAGAVSEPCAQAGPPQPHCANDAGCPSFPSICDAGSSCLCWGITRWCQQVQATSCSVSSDCFAGWTCSSATCEPPNSDLAYQGPLAGGTLVCGLVGGPGGFGGEGPAPGGLPGPDDSGSTIGDASSPTPPDSGDNTATTGSKSGGCEIGMDRSTGPFSRSVSLLCLATLAGGFRRRLARERGRGEAV